MTRLPLSTVYIACKLQEEGPTVRSPPSAGGRDVEGTALWWEQGEDPDIRFIPGLGRWAQEPHSLTGVRAHDVDKN